MAELKETRQTKQSDKFQIDNPKPEFKTQYAAAIISCIAAIGSGAVIGFSSPALPDMNLPAGRRFNLDDHQQSLVGSLATLGALCGGLIAGTAVDYFGRKSCLIFLMGPFVIGWLFIVYANSVALIYFGRLVTGVCLGVTCLNTSVYIAEISSPEIRGILGSGFQLSLNVGIFFAFCTGALVPWSYLAAISAIFPVMTMMLMLLVPESPVWLVRNKRILEAEKSLRWLRGPDFDVKAEIEVLCAQLENESSITLHEFFKPALLKPLLIMECEMFLQQFSGVTGIVFFAGKIFKMSSDFMEPNLQSIVVAALMIVSSVLSSMFIDKAGRRVLLMISAALMSLSLYVLGGFYYVYEHDRATSEKVLWLPVICLTIYNCIYSFGFGPVPWLMMGELFPSNARGLASSIVTASVWTFGFVIAQTFNGIQDAIYPYGAFWLFASASAVAVAFVWCFVPETKGKTLDEIQIYFTGTINTLT